MTSIKMRSISLEPGREAAQTKPRLSDVQQKRVRPAPDAGLCKLTGSQILHIEQPEIILFLSILDKVS